jgi:hypothetical protein
MHAPACWGLLLLLLLVLVLLLLLVLMKHGSAAGHDVW